MKTNLAYSSYQQNHVTVESPIKLVEMLYEGILRFVTQSKKAMENDDIEKKIYFINKTVDIFAELINSLDFNKGGDISHYLCGLYTHQIKLLTLANAENDTEKLDVVISVTRGLLEAWREVNTFEMA